MISTKQIAYALAVERTRHFKKAADQCSISQSALSTAIAEMEKQLGVALFERDNKKVLVTADGERVLAQARVVQRELDDLYLIAQQDTAPMSYPLSIGVIPTIGPYLLPKVLPAVRERYPDLRLSISEEQSHVLVDRVRNGELDTAILALPYAHEGLHAFEFWQEDLQVVVHRDSELANHKTLRADELGENDLMLLKDGHCLKDHALAVCHLPSSELDRSLKGTSLYTLIQMVAGKMGVTLVPEMATEQLLAGSAELCSVPLVEPGPHRRLAFLTRLNYGGVANIQLLMELFKEQLQKN